MALTQMDWAKQHSNHATELASRMTKIILIRHGHVEGIVPERFRGRQDLSLTDTGRKQAMAAARRIQASWKAVAVYSSPLSRCLETAGKIADSLGLKVETTPELVDINYGEWQGLTPKQAQARWPEAIKRWRDEPHLADIPGGESLAEVTARASRAFLQIVARHNKEAVVIVSHDSVNRLLMLWALGLPLSAFRRLRQDPCAINELDFVQGYAQLATMNETDHLRR